MKNTFVFLKEFISISQGKFHINLNVRTVHVFVYVLLNVEIALTVHTSKYGNFCDREVFTNFGKLKLVPKKRRKKKPKNNRLKKTSTDFVMHSELYCILGILSFYFSCRNNQHKHFVNNRIEKWNVKVMLLFVTAKVQKIFFNLQRLEIIFMGS